MYAPAPDGHGGGGGIEILILQLADASPVKSVCIIGSERLDIEVVSAPANLFIRSESNPDCAMLLSGVL